MVLEDKRKQQEAEEHRNDSMFKVRSKLIHDLKRVTEAHDDLQVKYTCMQVTFIIPGTYASLCCLQYCTPGVRRCIVFLSI